MTRVHDNPMTGIKEEGDKVSEGGRKVCEEEGVKRFWEEARGGRKGGRERGRKGGRERGRKGGRERGRKGGREREERERGREEEREGGRERGRKGGRERGRVGDRKKGRKRVVRREISFLREPGWGEEVRTPSSHMYIAL